MPRLSVAVTTLENNVKGTLKINGSRTKTRTIKKSYFRVIRSHKFCEDLMWVQGTCPGLSCRLGPSCPAWPLPSRCSSPPTLGQEDSEELWEKFISKAPVSAQPPSSSAPPEVKPRVNCSEQVIRTIKLLCLFVDL